MTQSGYGLYTSKSNGVSYDQGVITNENLWRLESDVSYGSTITGAHVSYPGSFVNAPDGTLERVSTNPAAYVGLTSSVEFTNNGTVKVTSGELRIDKVTAADDGIFDAATDAKLELTGSAAVVDATPRFTGQGTVTLKGDYVLDAAASVDAALVAPGALVISGDVGGAGTLSISGVGSWLSGTNSTLSADVVVTASGVLDIPGSYTKYVTGSLTNRGTVTQSGYGLYTSKSNGVSYDQGVITNENLWRLESDVSYGSTITGAHVSYPGSFVNAPDGTLERVSTNPAAYVGLNSSVEFTNKGTVKVTSGELRIDKVTAADDGIFDAATDAKLELTGSAAVVDATPRFTGQGTVTLKGDFVLDAAATVDAAMVAPGVLVLSADVGGAGTLSISGVGSWLSGTNSTLSADVVVTASGVLDIPGSYTRYVTGSLTNRGTVTQAGGGLYTSKSNGVSYDQGVITNENLWRLESDVSYGSTITGAHVSYPGSFVNASDGTLERVSTNPAAYVGLTSSVEFTNNGTVKVTSGELRIGKAPDHYSGTTFSGGEWEVGADAELDLPSAIVTNDADISLQGAGATIPDLTYFSGNLSANTGTLELLRGCRPDDRHRVHQQR